MPQPAKMIKRRLRTGWLYVITSVDETTPSELEGRTCRIVAQFPDAHLESRHLSATVVIHDGPFGGAQMLVRGTFKLKNPNPQTTCYCRAYEWPHRLGSGKCWGTTISIPGQTGFCGACGRPCHITDMAGETVSQCCASEVYTDCDLEEPL